MSNLPNIFTVTSRNPNPKRTFRASWGAKTHGIKNGDYVEGVILGFENSEFDKKNIIIKSFSHNDQPLMIWGCSSLQYELHADEKQTELLYNSGDVIRITFKGKYMGKKGKAIGKEIAIFEIGAIEGYSLTQIDIIEIQQFLDAQRATMPLQAYKPAPAAAAVQNPFRQPQQINYNQMQNVPQQQAQQLFFGMNNNQQIAQAPPMQNQFQQQQRATIQPTNFVPKNDQLDFDI